jgi:hypothetical protein
MSETGGSNIEVAHRLNEREEGEHPVQSSGIHQIVEVIEAIILAIVAITTAWSGYQAARWDSVQSELYGRSSRLRVEGQALETRANLEKMYDAATVAEWVKAEAHGETELASFFEKRLFPDIRPAFEAWKRTDPLHNPNAPAGAVFMPEYRNTMAEKAALDNDEATELFKTGTVARERADQYVRVTVFLATILLLTAIGQRFRSHWIRVALVTIAILMLSVPIWQLLSLPRI